MKATIPMLLSLLLVPAAIADAPAPTTPAVLALAPEDALAIVYLARPGDLFAHPFWTIVEANDDPRMAQLLESTAATFSGPTMLAVCGSPVNPMAWRIEIAVQPQGGHETFYKHLDEAWLPAVWQVTPQAAARLETAGDMHALRLPPPTPIGIFLTEENGLVYGSSRAADVMAWHAGQDLPPRFAGSADAAKLPATRLAEADAFFYLNLRPIVPLAGAELERLIPGLRAVLGLEEVEFGALTASWTRISPQVDVVFGVPADAGALDLLAPRNAPLDIAALVPADYISFARGAMTSAADALERLNAILDTVDPAIVAEFRTECAEFRREYGFDPLADFAANLVDEWIVAARIKPQGRPELLAAARLADPEKFKHQAELLIRGFKLEVTATPVDQGVIYSAAPDSGVQFAWTAIGDYVLAAGSVASILEALQARAEGTGLLNSPALASVTPRLPAESARLVFANLSEVARLALSEGDCDPEMGGFAESLRKLAEAQAGLGLAVTRGDGLLAIRVAASPSADESVRATAWSSIGASVARSRELSLRLVSAANIRGITQGCIIHANDHKGQWPDSLAVLVDSGTIAPQALRDPRAPHVEATESFYLYRDGTGLGPQEVVVCEAALREGGANFGFADGHVEWIAGDRARQLHALMVAAGR